MNDSPLIRVCARRHWAHTGYQLEKDATYRVTVPPGQHWHDSNIKYGPEGGVTGVLQRAFFKMLRYKGDDKHPAKYFTLVGTIGESLSHAFVIGAGPVAFTAPVSGELVCFANDVWFAYWNNSGSMKFLVERT